MLEECGLVHLRRELWPWGRRMKEAWQVMISPKKELCNLLKGARTNKAKLSVNIGLTILGLHPSQTAIYVKCPTVHNI